MATFFLIDHSLQNEGGHHFEYTHSVAEAARQIGFDVVIGTNRSFECAPESPLPAKWRPVFRNTTYQRDSFLPGLASLKRQHRVQKNQFKNDSLLGRWTAAMIQRRRRILIRQFASDFETFFEPDQFTTDDHAFVTTASELELLGLAAYLASHPRTLQVNWHLQFHFDLLEGRPAEYESQKKSLSLARDCFRKALTRIPYHQINFFVTSQELANQYNKMEVSEFVPLIYPIDPAFSSHRATNASTNAHLLSPDQSDLPIRISVAGGIRREKGQQAQLQQLVEAMWDQQLASGRAQLIVQRKPGTKYKSPKFRLELPEFDSNNQGEPVVYVDHPCPKSDYVNMVTQSDIGLFCYESRSYYSRRAGVLGEFLAAGIPVVVPAGCWLSQQISPAIDDHIQAQVDRHGDPESVVLDYQAEGNSNVPLQGGIWSFDKDRHPFRLGCTLRDNVDALATQFLWNWPRTPGAFCNIEVAQYDRELKLICQQVQTAGCYDNTVYTGAMFRIKKDCQQIRLTMRNAFGLETLSIADVKIHGITAGKEGCIPIGAVGAIASDGSGFAAALKEVMDHFPHYRQSAINFSKKWSQIHLPRRTVAKLIASERTSLNVA